MRGGIGLFGLASVLLVAACGTLHEPEPVAEDEPLGLYDYPLADPLAATVVGTPNEYKAALPKRVPVKHLKIDVFEDRVVPEVFWYHDRLKFSVARQDHPAPLVFNIAGTGAGYDANSMRVMQRAFYKAGFHVISLSSPTHANFIVAASSSSVPGRVRDDARDLYRVMRLAYETVRERIEVSEFYLTGYSLGGWQAAFVADLDGREKVFDFSKVLLINPPVSLFTTIRILDDLLISNLPGGISGLDKYFDRVFAAFVEIYKEHDFLDFSEDFLYRAYKKYQPGDEDLAALIGLSFRLSSNNMVFTADVMSGSGYIVPKARRLTASTSLTEYFMVGVRLSFEDYLDELFLPYFREKDPGLTRDDLVREASLRSIEDYLTREQKIGLLTNEDDVILAPGEIDYLKRVFGDRAQIFPTGGHLGNLEQRQVISTMIDFFKS